MTKVGWLDELEIFNNNSEKWGVDSTLEPTTVRRLIRAARELERATAVLAIIAAYNMEYTIEVAQEHTDMARAFLASLEETK